MAAGLTIAVIFAFSFIVVRIASVMMRLTGLPDHVARFQCISALTGTGFTTSESESIVNYPLRRRILLMLMLFGNLGLISVMATMVVSFVDVGSGIFAFLEQAAFFAVAIVFPVVLMTNDAIDRRLCGFIALVLKHFDLVDDSERTILLRFPDASEVVEVVHERNGDAIALTDLLERHTKAIPLAIRRENGAMETNISLQSRLVKGDAAIIFTPAHLDANANVKTLMRALCL